MSNDDRIALDDLILFFRGPGEDDNETIVNRWIPHSFYTKEERRVVVKPGWKDAVLSEPSTGNQTQPYYVANLARLVPPDEPSPSTTPTGTVPQVNPGPGDLVVFPPEDPNSCFRVTRADYVDNCEALPPTDIPDLEFMAREEGVVLACLPKVTPEGCTCILLNLLSLRSGALGGAGTTRTTLTHRVRAAYGRRDIRHNK